MQRQDEIRREFITRFYVATLMDKMNREPHVNPATRRPLLADLKRAASTNASLICCDGDDVLRLLRAGDVPSILRWQQGVLALLLRKPWQLEPPE